MNTPMYSLSRAGHMRAALTERIRDLFHKLLEKGHFLLNIHYFSLNSFVTLRAVWEHRVYYELASRGPHVGIEEL